MKHRRLPFWLTLFISTTVVSQEWPVYSPSSVVSVRDPANSNLAEIPLRSIILNDKYNCSSGCSWTIEMISRRKFRIWNSDLPLEDEIGHAKKEFLFSKGILKLINREEITFWGKWIFSKEPPNPGDRFYITVTANGAQAGNIAGGYCDYTSVAEVWHNYHSGIDIGEVENLTSPTPTPAPGDPTPIPGTVCHIYPVRSGEIVKVFIPDPNKQQSAVIVQTGVNIYDWYDHVQNDIFSVGNYSSHPIQVAADGPFATQLSSLVNHEYPHLHYGVCNDAQGDAPTTRSIKNPLHNLIPNTEYPMVPPVVVDNPSVRGICFRADDHGLPTPPTPFADSTISGMIDIEAKMQDFNGAPTNPTGINQIEYYLFSTFGAEKQFRESRVFMDRNVLCGEAGQNEYSPYYFDEYGFNRIEFQTIYGRGQFPSVLMHNYFYILTNNSDRSGGKAGFSTVGCWNTQETITTPGGAAGRYPDGPYTVLVRGADISGNWSDDSDPANARTITVLNDFNHVIYVDSLAAGQNADGSLERPYRTLTQAVPYGSPNTLISIAPGIYGADESFPINLLAGTTLIGAGHDLTNIESNGTQPVFLIDKDDCRISDLTIIGSGSSSHNLVVVENGANETIIENCTVNSSPESGIYLHVANYPMIRNCLISNHISDGILINDAWMADISNCTFANNNIGVNANDGAICAIVINSIFINHSRAIRAYNGSYLGVMTSDFYLSGSPWYITDGSSVILTDSNLQTNPLFESGSYYLHPSSSCINWGSASGYVQYGPYLNSWQVNPPIYLRTTRIDNQQFSNNLYDDGYVDLGYHYIPLVATPTPYPTLVPTFTPTPTNTPSPTPTQVVGQGVVYLDSDEYFTEGDTAEILISDADLNTDSFAMESYIVNVTSDTVYPTVIPITLTEISIDSEYFTTCAAGVDLGFSLSQSIPFEVIHVADGDTITVIYDDASPPEQRTVEATWYSAVPPTETPFPTSTPPAIPTSTMTPTVTPTAHSGIYYEDFETGASGWVTTGLWHLTTTDAHSPTHSIWYGQESSGDYDTGGSNSGCLTSPPIQLQSGYTTLTFWSREETEGTQYWDTRKVYVSNDEGASWDLLFQSTDNDNAWYQPRSIDLSPYTDTIIHLRFEFNTVDAGNNDFMGWRLDDVTIDDSPLPIPALGGIGKLILLVMFFALMATGGRKSKRFRE